MSDNYICLIPQDPQFVPEKRNQLAAQSRLAEVAPNADSVEVRESDSIEFFDCGANFERVLCPSCRAEVPMSWWQDRMDDDYGDGFSLREYVVPCCHAPHALNQLDYEWKQAFGRFALEAMNPQLEVLEERYQRELEEILGTKLHVIYQHL